MSLYNSAPTGGIKEGTIVYFDGTVWSVKALEGDTALLSTDNGEETRAEVEQLYVCPEPRQLHVGNPFLDYDEQP